MSDVKIHQVIQKPVIELTEAAKAHLLAGIKRHPQAVGVRFSVQKSGCSGLYYVTDYVDKAGENDISFPLSVHFRIFVDKNSIEYLQNMRVDYVYIKEEMGSKLVFLNPNQKGQCGCGKSFTV